MGEGIKLVDDGCGGETPERYKTRVRLTKKDVGVSALSHPNVPVTEYSDRRCQAFLYSALAEIRDAEFGGQRFTDAVKESEAVTITEHGAALIALLRRNDPSGRKAIQRYQAWTESLSRRQNSVCE